MKIYKTNLALLSGIAITILQHEDTNESANNAYQNFVKTHKETAEMLIPQKEKVKRKVPWENDIIIEKRK